MELQDGEVIPKGNTTYSESNALPYSEPTAITPTEEIDETAKRARYYNELLNAVKDTPEVAKFNLKPKADTDIVTDDELAGLGYQYADIYNKDKYTKGKLVGITYKPLDVAGNNSPFASINYELGDQIENKIVENNNKETLTQYNTAVTELNDPSLTIANSIDEVDPKKLSYVQYKKQRQSIPELPDVASSEDITPEHMAKLQVAMAAKTWNSIFEQVKDNPEVIALGYKPKKYDDIVSPKEEDFLEEKLKNKLNKEYAEKSKSTGIKFTPVEKLWDFNSGITDPIDNAINKKNEDEWLANTNKLAKQYGIAPFKSVEDYDQTHVAKWDAYNEKQLKKNNSTIAELNSKLPEKERFPIVKTNEEYQFIFPKLKAAAAKVQAEEVKKFEAKQVKEASKSVAEYNRATGSRYTLPKTKGEAKLVLEKINKEISTYKSKKKAVEDWNANPTGNPYASLGLPRPVDAQYKPYEVLGARVSGNEIVYPAKKITPAEEKAARDAIRASISDLDKNPKGKLIIENLKQLDPSLVPTPPTANVKSKPFTAPAQTYTVTATDANRPYQEQPSYQVDRNLSYVLSEKYTKDLEEQGNLVNISIRDLEKKVNDYTLSYDNLKNKISKEGYTEENNKELDRLDALRDNLSKENNTVSALSTINKVYAGHVFDAKATRGSLTGAAWNNFVAGGEDILNGLYSLEKTIGLGFSNPLKPFGYNFVNKNIKGLFQGDEVVRNIDEQQKKDIIEFASQLKSASSIFKANVSDEYVQKKIEEGSIGSILMQLPRSVPAMALGMVPALQPVAAEIFALQILGEKIPAALNDPRNANLTINQLLATTLPNAMVQGYIENISMKAFGKSMAWVGLTKKAGSEIAAKELISAKMFSDFIQSGVNKVGLNKYISENFVKTAGILLEQTTIEGFENVLQDVTNNVNNSIVNNILKEKHFDVNNSVNAYWESLKSGMVGGFVFGAVSTAGHTIVNKIKVESINNKQFELVRQALQYPAVMKSWVTDIKLKIANKEITLDEGKAYLAGVKEFGYIASKIPTDISVENQKKSFDLIKERMAIEQEVKGKDENLTLAKKQRITEINKQLQAISLETVAAVDNGQVVTTNADGTVTTTPAKTIDGVGTYEFEGKLYVEDKDGNIKLEDGTSVTDQKTIDKIKKEGIFTTQNANSKEAIDSRPNTELFPDETKNSMEVGGSNEKSKISSYREVNGIGITEYTNPTSGIVDVIMTGTSNNDFVGYVRVYENGKATERWTSKMENKSGNTKNFKTMISEAQRLLPAGHEYTEKTNISTDGLGVYAEQLNRGYEILTDESGNPVTEEVFINVSGNKVELSAVNNNEQDKKDFNVVDLGNTEAKRQQNFEKIKKQLAPLLSKLGLTENDVIRKTDDSGQITIESVAIRLPVLKSTNNGNNVTTQQTTEENGKDNQKDNSTSITEVERLRTEEQAELDEKIPNADQYRVYGKVDRTKLTNNADRKAFDEVYAKYDKLITPLLEKEKEGSVGVVGDVKQQELDAQRVNKEAGVDIYVARQVVDANGTKYTLSQINENGNTNTFVIEDANGNEIGKAQLSADANFLENIRINEKHRRRGLASKVYDFIELRKGIELEPSPNKQSKEAKALWDNRNLKKVTEQSIKETPKTRTVFDSLPVGIKASEGAPTSKVHVPLFTAAKTALKVLNKLFPDLEIHFHENSNDFQKVLDATANGKEASTTDGNFAYIKDSNGKYTVRIDINLSHPNASVTTVIHEAIHPILLSELGDKPETFEDLKNQVAKSVGFTKNAKLKEFIKAYDDTEQPEEYLVQLGAILKDSEKIEPNVFRRIAEAINKIVLKITNGKLKPFENVKNSNDTVRYFSSLVDAIRTGNLGNTKLRSQSQKSGAPEMGSKQSRGGLTATDMKSMTVADNGDLLFFHYGDIKGSKIDARKGTPKAYTTDKRVYTANYYYTNESDREGMVVGKVNVVRVPADKVYSFNKDVLGLFDEAKKNSEAHSKGQAFSPNRQADFIAQLAAKNGFDMVVAKWGNGYRAESPKALTIDAALTKQMRTNGSLSTAAVDEKLNQDIYNAAASKANGNSEKYRSAFYGIKDITAKDIMEHPILSRGVPKKLADKYNGGEIKSKQSRSNEDNLISTNIFIGRDNSISEISDSYKRKNNLSTNTPNMTFAVSDKDGKRIADAYDQMKHSPNDPSVKKGFADLITQIKSQADALMSKGYKFQIANEGEGYNSNSKAMVDDVRKTKRIFIDPSSKSFGTDRTFDKENIGLQDSGYKDANGIPMTNVELIRGVHDLFGHNEFGNGFGATGEENAWRNHMSMFTGLAQKALTATTRGQNSWVNFGKHMRNSDGSIKKKGDKGYLSANERPFAEQKIGFLPDWATENAYGDVVTIEGKSVKPVNKYVVEGSEVYEIDDASAFYTAMKNAKESDTLAGIQVELKPVEKIQEIIDKGGRLLITKDGKVGMMVYADGNAGGGFKNTSAEGKNLLKPLLLTSIKLGARYADAYDTFLPEYYSKFGFKPYKRIKFNPEYAEAGWENTILKSKPDIVVLYWDGGSRENIGKNYGKFPEYNKSDGEYTDDYEGAIKEARNISIAKEPTASLIPSKEVIKSKQSVTAWHGSPHSFDKFTTDAIGTGEGAQAFGWGLYFTDLKAIAEGYAKALTKKLPNFNGKTLNILSIEKKFGKNNISAKTLGLLQDAISSTKGAPTKQDLINYVNDNTIKGLDKQRDEALSLIETYNDGKNKEKLYEVTIHEGKTPEQYTWLEWDKPLTDSQLNKISEQANKENVNINKDLIKKNNPLSKDIYREIGTIISQNKGIKFSQSISFLNAAMKEASLFMLRAGIDGIKYPAESVSKGATSETARGFNYVVFDENAVTIKSKQSRVSDILNDTFNQEAKKTKIDKLDVKALARKVVDIIKSSKLYEQTDDIERENAIIDFLKTKGIVQKRVIEPRNKNIISVNEVTALKDQIRLEIKAANDGAKSIEDAVKKIGEIIKGLAKGKKISITSAKALINKFSNMNTANKDSVNSVLDYASKIFNDAEYADKVAQARALNAAMKRAASNNAIPPDTRSIALSFAKINPEAISDIDAHLEAAKKIKDALVGVKENGVKIRKAIDVNEMLDYLNRAMAEQETYDANNPTTTRVVEPLDEEKALEYLASEHDSLLQAAKAVAPSAVLTDAEMAQLKNFLKLSIDDFETMAEKIAAVEALDNFVKNADMGKIPFLLNNQQVKSNINKGVKAIMPKLTSVSLMWFSEQKAKLRGWFDNKTWYRDSPKDFSKTLAYFMNQSIRRIDNLIGNFKNNDVFNNTFKALASGYAKYLFKINSMDADVIFQKVLASFNGNMYKAVQHCYKMTMYKLQLEYESNIGNREVIPAMMHLEKTLKDGNLTKKDKAELRKLIEEFSITDATTGEVKIDTAKIWDSFSEVEKNAAEMLASYYEKLTPYAQHVAVSLRGVPFNPRANYMMLNVINQQTSLSATPPSASQVFAKGTTKAGTIIERDGTAHAVSLDPYNTFNAANRDVMMDYCLLNPIKTVEAIFDKLVEDTADDEKANDVAKSLQFVFKEITDSIINRSFVMSDKVWTDVFNYIKKVGARYMLAKIDKAPAEFAGNAIFAGIAYTENILEGIKNNAYQRNFELSQAMEALDSYSIDRLYPHKGQSGAFLDPNSFDIDVRDKKHFIDGASNVAQVVYYNSLLQAQKGGEAVSDFLVTAPDLAVGRMAWEGTLRLEFKKETGTEIDLEKIIKKDYDYLEEYKDALEKATTEADRVIVDIASSKNPFVGMAKESVRRDYNSFMTSIDGFLRSFSKNENQVGMDAAYALIKSGKIDRARGVRLLAAILARGGVYNSVRAKVLLLLTGLGFAIVNGITGGDDSEEKRRRRARLQLDYMNIEGDDWAEKSTVTAGKKIISAGNIYEVVTGGVTSTNPPSDTSGKIITDGTAKYKWVGTMPRIQGSITGIKDNVSMGTSLRTYDKEFIEKATKAAAPEETMSHSFNKGAAQSAVGIILGRNSGAIFSNLFMAPAVEYANEKFIHPAISSDPYNKYRDGIMYSKMIDRTRKDPELNFIIDNTGVFNPFFKAAVTGYRMFDNKYGDRLREVNKKIENHEKGVKVPREESSQSKYYELLNERDALLEKQKPVKAMMAKNIIIAALTVTGVLPSGKTIDAIADKTLQDKILSPSDMDNIIKNIENARNYSGGEPVRLENPKDNDKVLDYPEVYTNYILQGRKIPAKKP